jgi:hypothetical protein
MSLKYRQLNSDQSMINLWLMDDEQDENRVQSSNQQHMT